MCMSLEKANVYIVGTFVGDVAPTDRTDPTNDAIIKPSTTTAATTTTCYGISTWSWTHAVITGTSANFYGMYHLSYYRY